MKYVGEVVGIGQEVKGFKIGDRVSGEGHITCGHCRNCRGDRTHLSQHHRRGRQQIPAASRNTASRRLMRLNPG